MISSIESDALLVDVDSRGAQLKRILSRDGTDYLWSGDARYWSDQAPVLFPYVGRLTQGAYLLNGRRYEMGIHGFAAQCEFAVAAKTPDAIRLQLHDTAETRVQYPFHFDFCVDYFLRDKSLSITFSVTNTDSRRIAFGIGGHPGFRVPLDKRLSFEDYALVFDVPNRPMRIGMSEDCFVTGRDERLHLVNDRILPLAHTLFDHDAIILKDMARSVTLRSALSEKAVRIQYPDMRYLGVWHKPKSDAGYVCIEPWTSLPSRKGVVEALFCQNDLISLPPSECYRNTWSIEIDPRLEDETGVW